MSFAKKMKRKKETAIKKVVTKEATKGYLAEKRARELLEINMTRINLFCECRILPTMAYIMHDTFGWSCKQLWDIERKYKWFNNTYFLEALADKREYLTLQSIWESLGEECSFQYAPYKRLEEKMGDSCEGWLETLSKNYSIDGLEYIETIWLWVLHEYFGFGGKRLLRFHEALTDIKPLEMPMDRLYKMFETLESLKTRDGDRIKCDNIRNILKELDYKKNNFEDGLMLLTVKGKKKAA